MNNNENLIPIPGRLHSVATEGQVAGADEIYDDTQQKNQATINSELIEAVGTGGSVDTRITNAVDVEKTRAEGVESTLDSKITAEQTRATSAENALDNRVDTLEEAVGTGGSVDSRITSAVATETSRAQEAEADRYTKSETYTKEEVNNLITTPNQEYVSVTATNETTSVTDILPATGATNTIYRIGNWDGTQYNDTVFSEYAWTGSAYINLSIKSQIGEIYDISVNHADTKYANLAAALGVNGANIPQSLQKGGMSIKFVQSSGKYVQYRLTTDNWSIVLSDWQKEENINQYLLDKDAILFDFKDIESVGTVENGKNAQTLDNKIRIALDAASTYNLLTYNINGEKFFKCKCSSYNDSKYGVGVYFADSDNNILGKWYAETFGTYIVTLSVPDEAAKIYVNGIDGFVPECISGTLSDVPKYIAEIAQEKQERENADNEILGAIAQEKQERENADNEILGAIDPVLKAEHVKGESLGTVQNGKNMQIQSSGYVFIVDAPSTYNVLTYDINDEKLLLCKYSATSDTLYGVGVVFVDSNNNAISRQNEDVAGTYSREISVPDGATKVYVNGTDGLVPECNLINIQREFSFEYFDYISPKISLSLFENIGVIGDSYASGELYYNGDYHDKYNISWGQQIARKFGVQCINFSSGGLTTRTWLTATKGLPKLLNDPAQDLYLLVLGINDYYSLGSDYLGTIEDITSHESYADYGDTFYGNYGKIIEQTEQHAPNAKLVMFGLAATDETAVTFDNAIRNIAAHYNIPYINQKDDNFYLETVYTDMSGGHPTAIGYARMAIAFERLLSKCILDNIQYFGNYKMND